jgi:sulfate transport system ATP-binding protein
MGIAAHSISKRFGSFVALDDVDLDVETGQLTALLGPSGGGKSTLLRIIGGLEDPDAGSVHIDGVEATDIPAQRRNVGFVFQHYAAFKHLNVRDNVAYGLKIRRRPKAEVKAKVDNLLEVVGLSGFQTRYPNQLSGGQRQRMALARALAVDPQVLLLDEPFGALDAVTRRHMNIELERIWRQSRITTVLVTHSVSEALFLADRVVIMGTKPGRIVRVVTPMFQRQGRIDIMRSEGFHKLADELTAAIDPEGSAA